MSHPTWVRGLKPGGIGSTLAKVRSHPTWVRGLKRDVDGCVLYVGVVAPHVGAWIETPALPFGL